MTSTQREDVTVIDANQWRTPNVRTWSVALLIAAFAAAGAHAQESKPKAKRPSPRDMELALFEGRGIRANPYRGVPACHRGW